MVNTGKEKQRKRTKLDIIYPTMYLFVHLQELIWFWCRTSTIYGNTRISEGTIIASLLVVVPIVRSIILIIELISGCLHLTQSKREITHLREIFSVPPNVFVATKWSMNAKTLAVKNAL